MRQRIQQWAATIRRQERKTNLKVGQKSIPRTLPLRKFLHFLSRRKDRGASKS